jgi:hypothetical protein
MATHKLFGSFATLLGTAAILLCALSLSGPASAQIPTGPVAQPPYVLSIFANSTTAYTQPDSIVQWRDHILIGFSNGVSKTGSDGKFSTIVEYSLTGKVNRTFSVPGHNDGLRIVGEDDLWCLQNEDANPNLAVLDLESGRQKNYTFAPTVHGGGFDDMRVKDGKVLMTASNPNLNGAGVNVFPALVIATLHGDMVDVEPVLNGDANATDIPTGTAVPLNLTDPDSLAIDPRGNVLLDDQGDGQLIFIRRPFSDTPAVGRLNVTLAGVATTVDDTAFAPVASHSFMLVADIGNSAVGDGGTVYRIDSPPFGFEPGTAYSASDTAGFVGTLNLDTGAITTIVTGLNSGRGVLFVVPDEDGDRRQEGR